MKNIGKPFRLGLYVFMCGTLFACGGGGSGAASQNPGSGSDLGTSTTTTTTTTTSLPLGATVTSLRIEGLSSQTDIPVTFGQVFVGSEVTNAESIGGKLANGTPLNIQVDVKARHANGSLRHAIISTVLPQLAAGQTQTLDLVKTTAYTAAPAATALSDLISSGFTAGVNLTVNGTVYSASADDLLKSSSVTTWLSGPLVNEWQVSAPLKTGAGITHPHLTARFAIRSYTGLNKTRVDVIIENNWAYEPGPQNFIYDAEIRVGGAAVYNKTGLTHYHHARWRKTFWWGTAPTTHVLHDTAYLIASKAVPNYDQTIIASPTGLNALDVKWAGKNTEPMGPGIVNPLMPTAGGRPDIGPLPQWAALYVLSMDRRAKEITLGSGDLAGSWPIHYRDRNTGLPVSLADYPYMGLFGSPGDLINPVTKKSDAFPACGGDCSTSLNKNDSTITDANLRFNPDSAHQPSLAYVPYLVTGDHYYLEELHFWANWNMLRANPHYRGLDKGLVKWDEVRGQAWSTRTLGHASYITPDSHPMKPYFTARLNNNLDWYNTTFTNGNPNQLGVLYSPTSFQAIAYTTPAGAQTGLAPWQDDFFTWSVGYVSELGFANARPLLAWKAKFPVGRMTTPDYCWIDGAVYALAVRPTNTSPLYSTLLEAYLSTMRADDGTPLVNSTGAKYLDQACASQAQANWLTQKDKDDKVTRGPWAAGEMTGYATSATGYPSNMQPALAVAATSGIPNARNAWNIFMARPVKPDYSTEPQWAVVPRN